MGSHVDHTAVVLSREFERRWKAAALEGWTSIAVNLLLAAVKAVAGVISGSIALVADAVHSLSDVATSAVILFSYRLAREPCDEKHPFGHGRAESTATLIVAVLLVVAGLELGRSAVSRLLHPTPVKAAGWILWLVLGTVVAKEALAQFSFKLGRRIDSSALRADGWHHRTDAISSLLVLVALVLASRGLPWADGVMGLAVGAFIAYLGFRIARQAGSELLGETPDREFVERVKRVALAHPEVVDAHDVIVHTYGPRRIVSLHVGVPETLDLRRAHEIAEEVEAAVTKELGAHTTVHVDPVQLSSLLARVRSWLNEEVNSHDWLLSYHDVRVLQDGEDEALLVDLVVQPSVAAGRAGKEVVDLEKRLRDRFPEFSKVQVRAEPPFAM